MKRSRILAAALVAAGCSPETPEVTCPKRAACDGALDAGDDLGPADARADARDAPAEPPRDAIPIVGVVSITVAPASASLTARNGVPVMQRFAAEGLRTDGSRVPLAAVEWSAAPAVSSAGAIDPATGVFTATGGAGGRFTITAQLTRPGASTLTATATLDVQAEREFGRGGTGGATPEAIARFDAAPRASDAAREANVLYPLDQAVMPANVPSPDVQWERGADGDLYAVRLRKPHAEIRAWVPHTGAAFRFEHRVDAAAWNALVESDPEVALTVAVDRFDAAANQVVPGRELTVRVARATLSGAIYYWDLSEGRIFKLDAITAERAPAIPSAPTDPMDATNRCVACHTVSRDGRYMSAELWGGDRPSAVFDLTSSTLGSDPAPTVFPTNTVTYLFSTFSPDARYLVVNRANELRLVERESGATVPGSNLPTEHAAHPDWSPDGRRVAFITSTDGTWGVDFARGDVAVVDRMTDTTFGPQRTVHAGASTPERPADAHPSFSPDSRWIAFQHGTNSRSTNADAAMVRTDYPGRLEMTSADATPTTPALVLGRANGGALDSYWPNFSPFNAGGYFWVAFYSRRDYGNAQAGTRGTHRRQIWVTAVSNAPAAGADPSSVPYWLPGQSSGVDNMSAFWAPVACRMNAQTCSVSAECCSGVCQRGSDGTLRCDTPAMMECRRAGRTCSSSADCCSGLECFANVCGMPPG